MVAWAKVVAMSDQKWSDSGNVMKVESAEQRSKVFGHVQAGDQTTVRLLRFNADLTSQLHL